MKKKFKFKVYIFKFIYSKFFSLYNVYSKTIEFCSPHIVWTVAVSNIDDRFDDKTVIEIVIITWAISEKNNNNNKKFKKLLCLKRFKFMSNY